MGSGPRQSALQALLLTTRYIASLRVCRFSLTYPSLLEWFSVLLKQSKVTRSFTLLCFPPQLLTHQVASPTSYAFLILQDLWFSPLQSCHFSHSLAMVPPVSVYSICRQRGQGYMSWHLAWLTAPAALNYNDPRAGSIASFCICFSWFAVLKQP